MLLRTIAGLSLLLSCGIFGVCRMALWLLPVLYLGCFLGLLLLAFLILILLSLLVDLDKPQEHDSKFYRTVAHLLIETLIPLVCLKMEVSGLEKTPKDGRILLVCNHQNEADPGILMHYFKKNQLAFIAKKEARNMFVVGPFMHKLHCQLVNRENDREALKSILKCIQLIRDDEVSIGVFPEGGIFEKDKLHHFRSGVFKIAQRTGVPIVVCTLQGSEHVIKNVKKLKPSKVQLHLVDVISPEEYAGKTTVEIAKTVRTLMLNDLGEKYQPLEQNT